jgi:long-chain acyl-CoA synthetase
MPVTKVESIWELIQRAYRDQGEKIFIIDELENREITYRDFFADLISVQRYYAKMNIQAGDMVALISESSYIGYVFIVAALFASITVSPLNPGLKENEMQYALSLLNPKQIFISKEYMQRIGFIGQFSSRYLFKLIEPETIFNRGRNGDHDLDDAAAMNPQSEEGQIIIFTTGSTGRSKGVELTSHNILANIYDVAEYYNITAASRLIAYFPLTTIGSTVINILTTAYAGASVYLCRPFIEQSLFLKFIKDYWSIIDRYQISHIYANPSVLNTLLKFAKVFKGLNWKPQMIISSMAPLSVETQNAIEDLTGIPVLNGYGLTETTCRSLFGSYETAKRRKCSLGRPVYPTRIIADDGQPCPANVIGEIIISGPTVMKGYYHEPEATANVIRDGWFYTGDLGYCDDDNYFYILGRKKNIIIKHGNKISIEEVEETLQGFKGINDFAVVGVPDPVMGEKIILYYVDNEATPAEPGDLLKYCKENLTEYKWPDEIIKVKSIPRSASGKIFREELKKLYIESAKKA